MHKTVSFCGDFTFWIYKILKEYQTFFAKIIFILIIVQIFTKIQDSKPETFW